MSKCFVVVAVVAIAALGLVAAAGADAPTTTVTHFDRTRTLAAGPDTCPFPIVIHSVGDFRETVFSNPRDSTHAVDFHITYTNPATGKSVTSTLAGPFVVVPNDDGTVTVTINGNDGLFTAPGQGLIFGDVGKLVYIADPSDVFTPIAILKSTGHQDPTPFPAVCSALS